MIQKRRRSPGEELQRELLDGGPVLGTGKAPDGTWELRALHDSPDGSSPAYLYFFMEFRTPSGWKASSGGCGGLGLANEKRPVAISMSCRAQQGWFCYIGQVVDRASSVELTLNDGSTAQATLLRGDLPVQLWVAFTDRTTVATLIRAFDGGGELGAFSVPEDWLEAGGNVCWGPTD